MNTSTLTTEQSAPLPGLADQARWWRWGSRLLAFSVLVPLAVTWGSWLAFDAAVWSHLAGTVLPDLIINTLLLVVGVGIGTLAIGVSLAWLTSLCESTPA